MAGNPARTLTERGVFFLQDYHFFAADEPFRAGDSLRGHCVFNTSGAAAPMAYGVGHGDEMCLFLLYFAPFDSRVVMAENHLCSLVPAQDTAVADRDRVLLGA